MEQPANLVSARVRVITPLKLEASLYINTTNTVSNNSINRIRSESLNLMLKRGYERKQSPTFEP